MNATLVFPEKEPFVKPNEYDHHYAFIKKYAECAGIKVQLSTRTRQVFCTSGTCFSATLNERQFFMDYSDHEALAQYHETLPYFKFHYHSQRHGRHKNVIPVGPMIDLPQLADYSAFFSLCEQKIYSAQGNIVINCQQPRHRALERRQKVQQMLSAQYGKLADVSFAKGKQWSFWNKHQNALVAVCVPGARNNMLDRGHYEQLALGVCTISPTLNTVLPYGRALISGQHYLACADDYSDLIELIEWCKSNRDQCRIIGDAAGRLFKENVYPRRYWQWILQSLAVTN